MLELRLLAFVAVAALTGCKPDMKAASPAAPVPTAAATVVAVPSAPPKTAEEWRKLIENTFETSQKKEDGEGQTEFVACFDGKPPNCELISFANRDAFRKLTIFKPVHSRLNTYGSPNYIHSYISIKDCTAPRILLRASFFAKSGWLFLDKASVMADGEVVLEKTFDSSDVKRNNDSVGVFEEATWIASDNDIASMRKIVDSQKLIVRLTGSKGYITVDKQKAIEIQKDFKDLFAMYEALQRANVAAQLTVCN